MGQLPSFSLLYLLAIVSLFSLCLASSTDKKAIPLSHAADVITVSDDGRWIASALYKKSKNNQKNLLPSSTTTNFSDNNTNALVTIYDLVTQLSWVEQKLPQWPIWQLEFITSPYALNKTRQKTFKESSKELEHVDNKEKSPLIEKRLIHNSEEKKSKDVLSQKKLTGENYASSDQEIQDKPTLISSDETTSFSLDKEDGKTVIKSEDLDDTKISITSMTDEKSVSPEPVSLMGMSISAFLLDKHIKFPSNTNHYLSASESSLSVSSQLQSRQKRSSSWTCTVPKLIHSDNQDTRLVFNYMGQIGLSVGPGQVFRLSRDQKWMLTVPRVQWLRNMEHYTRYLLDQIHNQGSMLMNLDIESVHVTSPSHPQPSLNYPSLKFSADAADFLYYDVDTELASDLKIIWWWREALYAGSYKRKDKNVELQMDKSCNMEKLRGVHGIEVIDDRQKTNTNDLSSSLGMTIKKESVLEMYNCSYLFVKHANNIETLEISKASTRDSQSLEPLSNSNKSHASMVVTNQSSRFSSLIALMTVKNVHFIEVIQERDFKPILTEDKKDLFTNKEDIVQQAFLRYSFPIPEGKLVKVFKWLPSDNVDKSKASEESRFIMILEDKSMVLQLITGKIIVNPLIDSFSWTFNVGKLTNLPKIESIGISKNGRYAVLAIKPTLEKEKSMASVVPIEYFFY